MRYREKELNILYPGTNWDEYYVLWIDFNALFPFGFADADVYIGLEGRHIVHSKAQLAAGKIYIAPKKVAFVQKKLHWYSASVHSKCRGVPFFFKRKKDLEKVEAVTCTFSFSYYNRYDQKNVSILHSINGVSCIGENEDKDFSLTISGTVIPGLMEEIEIDERKQIIDRYKTVLQAKANFNVKHRWEVPVYATAIKESEEKFDILGTTNEIIDYLLANDRIGDINQAFLNIFINDDKILLEARHHKKKKG